MLKTPQFKNLACYFEKTLADFGMSTVENLNFVKLVLDISENGAILLLS